jgi:hypothetical protein
VVQTLKHTSLFFKLVSILFALRSGLRKGVGKCCPWKLSLVPEDMRCRCRCAIGCGAAPVYSLTYSELVVKVSDSRTHLRISRLVSVETCSPHHRQKIGIASWTPYIHSFARCGFTAKLALHVHVQGHNSCDACYVTGILTYKIKKARLAWNARQQSPTMPSMFRYVQAHTSPKGLTGAALQT